MRLPSRRGLFVAAVLTMAGAVVVTVVEMAVTYIAMTTTLHGKYGLPLDTIYSAIGASAIWRELFETLFAYAILIWPLAAWRLPLIGSLGGLAVVEGAFFLVADGGEIRTAVLLMSVIGAFVIVLLRAFDWAHRRFGKETA